MTRSLTTTVMGTALVCLAGWSNAQAAAPISAVVLYPGSATITRTGHVEAGTRELVISGLTAGFSTQTLRVDADAGIRIGQIDTRDAGQVESTNPAQAALEAQIQALRDEEAARDVEADAANIVKGYLEHLGADANPSTDRTRTAIDARTLEALVTIIGRSANDVLGKVQRVAVQKRDIEKKIAALQRDLQRLRADNRDSRTVTIKLAATHAGAVRLSYQVDNAGWKPGYRAELNSADSSVNLQRLAQVSQKTGEDWKDVRVVLSTSQPRLSPVAPSPSPWLLTYSPLAPVMMELKRARVADALAMSPVAAPAAGSAPAEVAENPEPAYVPPTFETDAAFATEFEVPSAVTLLSDGREISLELARQTLAVRQRLQVSPRIDRNATVTAEAERPAGVWLAGDMQRYRDGNYVGAAPWNPQATEKFALDFGRDELLRVTLDRLKGNEGKTGVFERRNARHIADVITLRSAHTAPVDVLVLEASPVSTADEIKVSTAFDPDPAIRAWDQRRGVVAWEKTLRPGEAFRIGVDYTIEYPKEGTVSGLNR